METDLLNLTFFFKYKSVFGVVFFNKNKVNYVSKGSLTVYIKFDIRRCNVVLFGFCVNVR